MIAYAVGVAMTTIGAVIAATGGFMEITGTPNGAVQTGMMIAMLGCGVMLYGAVRS